MNIFKSNKKQEPKPLSELETVLKLQDEHTRLSIHLSEIYHRLKRGYTIVNTSIILDDSIEMKIHNELLALVNIAKEYVRLAEKTGEKIPDSIAKYCTKYSDQQTDTPH